MRRVSIVGASGFVGQHIINRISKNSKIAAISRREKDSNDTNVCWVSTDLFSLKSTISALQNTDIAIYLVHSMMPSSRLFQGDFHDTDLMLADNFARACKKNNIKQIIYLGGLVPDGFISSHLESRKEVEDVLRSTGIPLTILRAGMIVGDGGSSFEILKNLVINLPAMILPNWTKSFTQTIYIDDLIDVLDDSIENPDYYNKTVNVVNGEITTYERLIRAMAKFVGKRRILFPLPINSTSFSKLWVTIFGHSSYKLVDPLVDSLVCDLPQVRPDSLIEKHIKHHSFESMLGLVDKKKQAMRKPFRLEDNTVRSIQRLKNHGNLPIEKVAQEYMTWLPKFFRYFIRVQQEGTVIHFKVLFLRTPLLTLQHIEETEDIERQKFHIIGGFLTKTVDTGWLEFRKVSNNRYTLASINEFVPALPWYIYRYSQAILHKIVMFRFSSHLRSMPLHKNS